jgi:hypothetical protein
MPEAVILSLKLLRALRTGIVPARLRPLPALFIEEPRESSLEYVGVVRAATSLLPPK